MIFGFFLLQNNYLQFHTIIHLYFYFHTDDASHIIAGLVAFISISLVAVACVCCRRGKRGFEVISFISLKSKFTEVKINGSKKRKNIYIDSVSMAGNKIKISNICIIALHYYIYTRQINVAWEAEIEIYLF